MKSSVFMSLVLLNRNSLPRSKGTEGFTLIEVLVSSVIILIAMVGSIAAFNLIVQSVRGTGLRADQSRRIDAQIAEISRISEIYTACGTPEGAVPADPVTPATACAGTTVNVEAGNSYYYFPDPANPAFVARFFAACRSGAESGHITAAFVDAIDAINPPVGTFEGNVTRLAAARVDPLDLSNHVVQVIWESDTGLELRTFGISPLVTSWCP